MANNKNLLNAAEARKLSETSTCQINRILKEIKESASENKDRVYWSVYNTDATALNTLIAELTSRGFIIDLLYEDDSQKPITLIAKW